MRNLIMSTLAVFLMSSCGGGSSKSNTGDPLPGYGYDVKGLPEGIVITTASGTVPTNFPGNQLYHLRNEDGQSIFEFKMVDDIDFTGLIAERTNTVSIAKLVSTAGMEGPITLFVPCLVDSNILYVCPEVEAGADVTATCANASALSVVRPESDGFDYSNSATRLADNDCEIVTDLEDFGMGVTATHVDPHVSYADLSFNEIAIDNVGTIEGANLITATTHRFSQASGDLQAGVHYNITGGPIPPGLTPRLAVVNATTVSFTLDGVATAHAMADSVASFVVTFLPAAFWANVEPGDTSQIADFSITFTD